MSTEQTVRLSDFAPQGALYDSLTIVLQNDRLPHACLITGTEGVGKKTLAHLLTMHLLCTGEHKPCGICRACRQILSDNHPDVTTVQVGQPIAAGVRKDMTVIPVNDIRELVRLCAATPYEGSRRVIRIWQAEKMNPAAQNALLKTLEEPPEGTFFFLTTENPRLLLPTIVSRCRELALHAWPDEVVRKAVQMAAPDSQHTEELIRLAAGSPGKAIEIASDEKYWAFREEVLHSVWGLRNRSAISALSLSWKERSGEADRLLSTMEDMTHLLLAARLGFPVSTNEYPAEWQRMAREADLSAFSSLHDAIIQAKKYREAHVTWQAVLEQLLLRLMEEKAKWQT